MSKDTITAEDVKALEEAAGSNKFMNVIRGAFTGEAFMGFLDRQVEVQQEAAVVTAKVELGRIAVDNGYKAIMHIVPESVSAKFTDNKFYEGALKFVLGNAIGAAFLFEAGRHAEGTRRHTICRFCADACIYQSQMALLGGFQLDKLLTGLLSGAEKYLDQIPGLAKPEDVVLPS